MSVFPNPLDGPPIDPGAELLGVEQEFIRIRGPVENVPLELKPQLGVHDRQVADLSALAEDREPASVVVLELDADELALAGSEAEKQQKCHAIALPRLRRRELPHISLGEGSACYLALARADDRNRRVRLQAALPHCPGEVVA